MNRTVPLARAALLASAVLLAVTLAVPAGDDTKPPPSKAPVRHVGVFVGVQKYATDRVRDLRAPETDAKRMEKELKAACGLFPTYVLTNHDAKLDAITDVFTKKLPAVTRPGDEVIVYWSGHGMHLPEVNPKADPPARLFLIPYDGDPFSADTVRKTMLMDTVFLDWIVKGLEGRRVLVILDTCHSGGATVVRAGGTKFEVKTIEPPPVPGARAVADPATFPKHFLDGAMRNVRAPSRPWVLASSRADQRSYELASGDHGVMTYFFLDAMANEKKGKPLTVADVADVLARKVPAYVQDNDYPAPQNPVLDGPPQPAPVPVIRLR
jgi:hypothetical protein